MSFFSKQRDPKRRRFPIPNDVWKWELKPQGFAILAYRCYLHVHCKEDTLPRVDEIASQLHMGKDMAAKQLSELNRRGLLDQHMVPMLESSGKNFFSLPNELFFLNIGHGAITVYAYLLYCENRRTHQCHPSYRTISDAVHLAVSTVMKHITKLVDKQLIAVENTNYIDNHGMKWNGNNLYTILPIQMAMDHCYQQQMLRLEEQQKQDQAQKRLGWNAANAPCARVPRCEGLCAHFRGRAESLPHRWLWGRIWPDFGPAESTGRGRKKKQDKGEASTATPFAGHICPQCGQFQGFPWALEMGSKSERKQSSAVVIPQCLLPQEKSRGQAPERSHDEQKREIPSLPVSGEKGHPGAPVSGGREPQPHRIY